jgi:hypothetical protein
MRKAPHPFRRAHFFLFVFFCGYGANNWRARQGRCVYWGVPNVSKIILMDQSKWLLQKQKKIWAKPSTNY